MSLITVPYVSTEEQLEVLECFALMLHAVTTDGGRKRARNEKPSWKVDPSHEAAIFSHLNKWKHGEKCDLDSGAHPLVHLAWRALAIAWQETQYGAKGGVPARISAEPSLAADPKYTPAFWPLLRKRPTGDAIKDKDLKLNSEEAY